MDKDSFFGRLQSIFGDCLDLARRKNNDYAGEDALANFREFGSYGVAVRLSDKMKRLINFAKGGQLKVKDESIIDTCMDIINYAAIYIIMKEEEGVDEVEMGAFGRKLKDGIPLDDQLIPDRYEIIEDEDDNNG